MMTEQEAIDLFNNMVIDPKLGVENMCKTSELMNVAIAALEKQIPTKPQEINEERIRLDGIWDWSCGKCGRFHRNDYPLNYCNECGQKVDWSDWV